MRFPFQVPAVLAIFAVMFLKDFEESGKSVNVATELEQIGARTFNLELTCINPDGCYVVPAAQSCEGDNSAVDRADSTDDEIWSWKYSATEQATPVDECGVCVTNAVSRFSLHLLAPQFICTHRAAEKCSSGANAGRSMDDVFSQSAFAKSMQVAKQCFFVNCGDPIPPVENLSAKHLPQIESD